MGGGGARMGGGGAKTVKRYRTGIRCLLVKYTRFKMINLIS